jgi:hypothetical protein
MGITTWWGPVFTIGATGAGVSLISLIVVLLSGKQGRSKSDQIQATGAATQDSKL